MRTLPSGQVQVRYLGPDGLRRNAPRTFVAKAAASRWLSLCEADMLRGTWTDPHETGELLSRYAARWIVERSGISERTARFYEGLLRLHIEPHLGKHDLRRITPAMVRVLASGPHRPGRGRQHRIQGVPAAARGLEHCR